MEQCGIWNIYSSTIRAIPSEIENNHKCFSMKIHIVIIIVVVVVVAHRTKKLLLTRCTSLIYVLSSQQLDSSRDENHNSDDNLCALCEQKYNIFCCCCIFSAAHTHREMNFIFYSSFSHDMSRQLKWHLDLLLSIQLDIGFIQLCISLQTFLIQAGDGFTYLVV